MSVPAVSVIMNCLNSSRDLREAMDSIMAQTFTDFEIVFWDNGSTDESPAIAMSYGEKVRYFRGETTVPLGAGRNLALAQARGRYIAFLDCDDIWRPRKLELQVGLFEANPRVGLVSTDTEIFDGKRVIKRLFAETHPARGMAFAALMERQWISMSSAMVRAEAGDHVLDIVRQRGLAQVEGEIVHHLHFTIEDIQFVAAVDHELAKHFTQRARLAILHLLDREIGQIAAFEPCAEFRQAGSSSKSCMIRGMSSRFWRICTTSGI